MTQNVIDTDQYDAAKDELWDYVVKMQKKYNY